MERSKYAQRTRIYHEMYQWNAIDTLNEHVFHTEMYQWNALDTLNELVVIMMCIDGTL